MSHQRALAAPAATSTLWRGCVSSSRGSSAPSEMLHQRALAAPAATSTLWKGFASSPRGSSAPPE
eukprot:8903859-Karenia_brevis.AAC.1